MLCLQIALSHFAAWRGNVLFRKISRAEVYRVRSIALYFPMCFFRAGRKNFTVVTAATVLLHFTEKGGILQKFDDDLFKEYVNRIVVRSRNEVCFELKCGLTLRERM